MKAVVCEAFGPLAQLRVAELPAPAPGAGEVLIDVHACGVNFPDVLIVQGQYQVRPALPFSPGAEVAGVVRELGAGVSGLTPGDRVMAWLGYGGYAEQACARADDVFPIPAALDFDTAAVLLTYGTAYYALCQRGALRAGETVAVLGAGGGVGLACVELAHALGARVIACASTPQKLATAADHGAAVGINYAEADFRAALKQATGGRGVDVLCDPVGGDLSEAAFRSLAWGGRYLVLGFAAGEIPRLALNLALLKGASLVGVFWGSFTEREPALHRANVAALLELLAAGRIAPLISRRFGLQQSRQALQLLSERQALGKFVVSLRDGG